MVKAFARKDYSRANYCRLRHVIFSSWIDKITLKNRQTIHSTVVREFVNRVYRMQKIDICENFGFVRIHMYFILLFYEGHFQRTKAKKVNLKVIRWSDNMKIYSRIITFRWWSHWKPPSFLAGTTYMQIFCRRSSSATEYSYFFMSTTSMNTVGLRFGEKLSSP